jgi:hypothetical protein
LSNRAVLIIPGGGKFADAARNTLVQGTPAHWMGIAGMEQYGWYLSSFNIQTTEKAEIFELPHIFLPYKYLREKNPLPHSWDVTSDTIGAWLASNLCADLLILKSIDQIRAGDKPVDQIITPFVTNDLDPCFIPFILKNNITGLIINGMIPERITDAIQGREVLSTKFGITF